MGTYAYCLVEAGLAPPEGLEGLDGAPVEAAAVAEQLWAWTSSLPARPKADVDAIRIHNRVVSAVLDCCSTPLPLRFGQWMEDRDALLARLSDRAPVLTRALAKVEGAVEYGVRAMEASAGAAAMTEDVVRATSPENAESPGRAYLAAAAARLHEREQGGGAASAALRELAARVGGVVRDSVVEEATGPSAGAASVFLVDRNEVDAFLELARSFRRERADLRFLITGPWPPYSFAP